MTGQPKVSLAVDLPPEVVEALQTIAETVDYLHDPADVLADLADHVEQGVRRPGSWERPWLLSAFPVEW